MQIGNSYIIDQARLSAPGAETSPANQAGKQQRIQQVKDSYGKNAASAQVIDAEYVDTYSPDNITLQRERQDLNLTLEPEQTSPKQQPVDRNSNSVASKYDMPPIDTPPPGTYLNVFA